MPIAQLESCSINYLLLGSNSVGLHDEPVIFVHGLATSFAFWMPAVQTVSDLRKIVLFDLRGHGRSSMPADRYTPAQMAKDLNELMGEIGIRSATVVGHSYGGAVALHLACLYPGRVSRLVLADARSKLLQPHQVPRNWAHWPVLKEKLLPLGIEIDDDDEEGGYRILTELARLQSRTEGGTMDVPKWLAGFFGVGSAYAARRWLELLDTTSAWADLRVGESIGIEDIRALKIPSMAVYGELSPVMPTAVALQELWPHLVFRSIPGAGHFFPMTQAAAFGVFLRAFLESA